MFCGYKDNLQLEKQKYKKKVTNFLLKNKLKAEL
jgi:hypothetical protein